jgi:hypothetical protein
LYRQIAESPNRRPDLPPASCSQGLAEVTWIKSASPTKRRWAMQLNQMAEQSDYLAQPSGQCCQKGHLHVHEGEPRGEHMTIAGVDTYIARPSAKLANRHILLYFPDVWGFFHNGFLIMDGFADAGYLTLGLDYFRGVRDCLAFPLSHGVHVQVADVLSGPGMEASKEPP